MNGLLLVGLFFAMFSVWNIWLFGRISKRLGASDWEVRIASALLALSSTFFYYARHVMPYDVSMTFGLWALLDTATVVLPWPMHLCWPGPRCAGQAA